MLKASGTRLRKPRVAASLAHWKASFEEASREAIAEAWRSKAEAELQASLEAADRAVALGARHRQALERELDRLARQHVDPAEVEKARRQRAQATREREEAQQRVRALREQLDTSRALIAEGETARAASRQVPAASRQAPSDSEGYVRSDSYGSWVSGSRTPSEGSR